MANWTNIEVKKLQALWPLASIDEIAAALPRHKPATIGAYAHKLGLRRPVRNTADKAHPLMAQLRARRLALGLSQDEVAGRGGFDRACIIQAENGHRLPHFLILEKWCSALDVDLVLVDKLENSKLGVAHPRSLPDARLDGDSEYGSQAHLTPVVPVIHIMEPT